MSWKLNTDRPIYLQLMDNIKFRIISGVYPPGDKLPSVRDLAAEAAVNPNTMQKALSELEREGYIESQRTSGRLVADRGKKIDRLKQDMALELCESFYNGMKKIGFTPEEALAEYKGYISRMEE